MAQKSLREMVAHNSWIYRIAPNQIIKKLSNRSTRIERVHLKKQILRSLSDRKLY